jgi:D-proline reductase (dithiol) PrdB
VLLQNIIEKSGIPTVSISVLMDITREVAPPRVLAVDRPLGFPLGEADNPELQREIVLAALGLLWRGDELPVEETHRGR